jgi:hypothetical protein
VDTGDQDGIVSMMVAKGIVRAGRIEVTEGTLPPEGSTVEVELRVAAPPPEDPALAFFGIWRDRDDLRDSRDYVSRLRDEQWRR